MKESSPQYPTELAFDELPDPKRVWAGVPGSREEGLGRLVLLTSECTRDSAQEIMTGQRVGLNWDLRKLEHPGYGRISCDHRVVPILDGDAFDDVYTINPQQSSQWDGLRHWGILSDQEPTRREWYGGTSKAEIMDRSSDRIGIHHWAREGITGRAVLIDYASWADKRAINYSAFSLHSIKLQDILAIAEESGIAFKKGDILLVRSGMIREWEKMDDEAKKAYQALESPHHAGLEATTDVLRWVWDTGFAAVAGDAISFEVFPPLGDISLHDYFLASWGMPIGEMFDLERLANTCKQLNRWTFFFASMPLNMPGGVSSPPNAQAIF
ncbi:hypothetical protein ACHAQH_009664 [Verticillium albo-atrum]